MMNDIDAMALFRLSVLARLNAVPAPESAATALQVATKPLANTERYDSLRAASTEEADHA